MLTQAMGQVHQRAWDEAGSMLACTSDTLPLSRFPLHAR
jgi:hypothetical protein